MRLISAILTSSCLLFSSQLLAAQLDIGLRGDPGSLDPATNATFIGRQSLQSICDKLVDIDAEGNVVPMLATKWSWSADGTVLTMSLRNDVLFHDGTKMDAEAVSVNLQRYLTLQGSRRRAELSVIKSIDVVDPLTVKLTLSSPSIPLLAQFTDRAGMILSPKAIATKSAEELAVAPVCAGPYKVTEFEQLQTITLDKFPQHWRADQYHFDRIVFHSLPDSSIRLLNLRAGQLGLIENVSATDLDQIEKDKTLKTYVGDQPAFDAITFNMVGPSANPDIAKYPEVRQAFSMAIDRQALNQVAFAGRYSPGDQPFPPSSPWANQALVPPIYDPVAAKALLKKVGLDSVKVDLLVNTASDRTQVAEILQSMLAAAGFEMKISVVEGVSAQKMITDGKYQAVIGGSGGRVDPDLNISLFVSCNTANNTGHYCNKDLDALLDKGRQTSDPAARKALYDQILAILAKDVPLVYLYNPRAAFASTAKLAGFVPFPDGIIRLEGVSQP